MMFGYATNETEELMPLPILLAQKLTNKSGDFKNIGGFGAISKIPNNLKKPQIVASTDGVGTKIEIANELKKFDTIGIDLVEIGRAHV